MPEVNVNPVLPITPSAPVASANASRDAVGNGDQGPSSFSQMLRDKQAANSKETAAPNTGAAKPAKPAAGAAKGTADADKPETPADTAAATPRTPAEIAQLLAAAGLMSKAADATTKAATTEDPAAVATTDQAPIALPQGPLTVLPIADKPAADTAKLAATTANTDTATSQTTGNQNAPLAVTDGKTGTGQQDDQPGEDKTAKLALPTSGSNEAERTDARNATPDFAAALDQASRNADAGRNPTAVHAATGPAAQPATHAVAQHTVTTPVGRQGWAEEVGQRVLWTAKQDNSRAELVLTPPSLGRIEISIDMKGDQANASFVAVNPIAREALQDAMPRLREMLAQSGIQLGQADVGAGQSGQANSSGEGSRGRSGQSGQGGIATGGEVRSATVTRSGTGLVDTFA